MRTETLIVLAVALGSALGGVARYGLSGLVARSFGETFPWGTLIVNVLGSFLIGFVATLTGPDGRVLVSPVTRQFWMPGIFGGFTTFSSFSLQTLSLAQDGEWTRALANVTLSIALCLLGVWLGEADKAPGGKPLYEEVVLKAREMGLAGATVLRGPMGFGRNSHLHTAKILRLSADLPMIVELVDAEAKVRALLDAIEPIMGSGLVTLERVQVIRYGAPPAR